MSERRFVLIDGVAVQVTVSRRSVVGIDGQSRDECSTNVRLPDGTQVASTAGADASLTDTQINGIVRGSLATRLAIRGVLHKRLPPDLHG
ncbi:MAG: hypothetical protein ABJC26_07625 [Gemmatimonadaceae bacterium]